MNLTRQCQIPRPQCALWLAGKHSCGNLAFINLLQPPAISPPFTTTPDRPPNLDYRTSLSPLLPPRVPSSLSPIAPVISTNSNSPRANKNLPTTTLRPKGLSLSRRGSHQRAHLRPRPDWGAYTTLLTQKQGRPPSGRHPAGNI